MSLFAKPQLAIFVNCKKSKKVEEVAISKDDIIEALHEVKDPEIPTLSVVELGIIIDVKIDNGDVKIIMTPTFSGCPALNILREQVRVRASKVPGVKSSEVEISYDTHWTTNMISDEGRRKLKEFGIAPPACYQSELDVSTIAEVSCPYCGSDDTRMDSPFGPTLCRSIHYCNNCKQTFEQFKPVD